MEEEQVGVMEKKQKQTVETTLLLTVFMILIIAVPLAFAYVLITR